ncbi:hypothetical protein EVAR_49520_1 [Eumeta japonica]|uniref:Uncharacterized protein n=1 Tax=Eumeta variegata TaxID=151549 RepID=A0A4C1XMG4_EUMVA|nr:hypothetical protein EVAR_49520_1 [Eumeta japonica]
MAEAAAEAAAGAAAGAGEEAAGAERALQLEAEERREEEERRRHREPPIVFRELPAEEVFGELVEALGETPLSPDEQRSLDELHQYLVLGEGSWALGDDFLIFVGRLLNDESVSSTVRVALLRCLAACALRDDVALLLHQDRRDHALMNYAHGVDRLPAAEARALALLICNLFESVASSEWLLYISEWEATGGARSNIRATTKVAVHALLADDDAMRDIGTAIVHNLATKERFFVGKKLRDLLPRGAKSKVTSARAAPPA